MTYPTKKLGEIIVMIKSFIKTHPTSIIWFIFTVLFLYMAYREWQKSKEEIKSLNNMYPQPIGQVKILGIDFAEILKIFKTKLNKSNKESHKIASISYLIAGITSLASFIVSL